MQLLTPKEVAARLNVSPRTVYSWIAEGRLEAVHLSERVTRVPEESVDGLLAAAMTPATATVPAPAVEGSALSESERLRVCLRAHREEIIRIVALSKGLNVRVFGSVIRGDATEKSDIDLLIDAQPGMSLFDLSDIESRVEGIVGRKIDVVVGRSLRPEISERVLAEARTL
jgi:excisionase family DNA binding protein